MQKEHLGTLLFAVTFLAWGAAAAYQEMGLPTVLMFFLAAAAYGAAVLRPAWLPWPHGVALAAFLVFGVEVYNPFRFSASFAAFVLFCSALVGELAFRRRPQLGTVTAVLGALGAALWVYVDLAEPAWQPGNVLALCACVAAARVHRSA